MQRSEFNLKLGIFWSAVLHAFVLAILAGVFGKYLPEKEPEVIKIQLVSAAQLAKQQKKPTKAQQPKKPEEIKTQASTAPKEAPKEIAKPNDKPKTQAPKVKAPEKAKPKETPKPKEADKKSEEQNKNEQEKAKRRPPKLDKTPDKTKAIRSESAKAKTVADADDFLAALDFVDKLEQEQPKETEDKGKDDHENEEEVLTLADQSELNAIAKHVRKYWILPPGIDGADEMSASVKLTVKQDGSIGNLRVAESSGHPFFDNALLRAVRKAVPLPIPAEKYETFREMELHFSGKQVE